MRHRGVELVCSTPLICPHPGACVGLVGAGTGITGVRPWRDPASLTVVAAFADSQNMQQQPID
ncbi:MAG: hypothetical protein ACRDTT_28515 [Pseudonocardiaceae bacterium]